MVSPRRPAPAVDGRSRARSDDGQASVEHVALASLVAVVLAAAVVVAAGLSGNAIANDVHSGIRRAICVATGDDCAAFHVRQPCAVATDEDRRSRGATIGFWSLGADRSVVVERRSDGSVAVTVYDDLEGRAGTSVGIRFGRGRATSRGEDGDGPIELSAGVEGRLRGGWGRTWEFPDASSAGGFLRRLRDRRPTRAPDVERIRVAADATFTGEVSGPFDVAGAHASLLRGLAGEGTRDRRTGRTTVSLAISRAVAADLAAPFGLQLEGSVDLERSATLVTDGDLRPRELVLQGTVADRRGSRRRDVRLRVDLTRPQVAAGISGVLRGLVSGDPARARATAAAVGRWASDEGWIDEREYATTSATDGFDGEVAFGVGLGLKDTRTHEEERLVAARSRPPGGLWEDRTDCVRPRP